VYGEKEENRNLVLGEQAVLEMHEDCAGKNHYPYFNNFSSSTKLMKMLLDMSWKKGFINGIQEP
jgi:hypothetical protein